MKKANRIKDISTEIGTRKDRKIRRFSKRFKEIYNFFLSSNKSGILTFSGTHLPTIIESEDGYPPMECFRRYDNGQYKMKAIKTTNKKELEMALKGKKSWGLWKNEWSTGIAESLFTIHEIISQFNNIPDSLMEDFANSIQEQKSIRNMKELKRIRSL